MTGQTTFDLDALPAVVSVRPARKRRRAPRGAYYVLDRNYDDADVALGWAINRVLFSGAELLSVRETDTDAEVYRVELDADGRGISIHTQGGTR